MKKQGKKRALVLVAMVVLLAVVLGMGGTTFAKYITVEQVPTQQATVAKWGYVVTTNTNNLFGTKYKGTGLATVNDSGTSVVAGGTSKVVAPGTTGSFDIDINGEAEVLSKLTIKFANDGKQAIALTKDVEGATVAYEPIVWTVVGTATVGSVSILPTGHTNDTKYNMAGLVELMEKLSQASIAANTTVAIDLTVTWTWAFYTDDTKDNYDTALGYLIAGSEEKGEAAGQTTMKLEFNITLEQIQAA